MKKALPVILFCFSFLPVFAKHITGGEVIYDYLGPGGGNTNNYRITLRLFRDNLTMGGAQMPTAVRLGIFNNDNNFQFGPFHDIPLVSITPVGIVSSPPCLTNAPQLDYSIGIYFLEISLPQNATGYTVSYQTCCRIDNIENIGNTQSIGATYIGSIPGNNSLTDDNSARFQTGISIICQHNSFVLNFSAVDPDGDSLVYSYANAYNGGSVTDAGLDNDPSPPPYGFVPYSSGYAGSNPFGTGSILNSATGIISGTAPDAGAYIVCVVVRSYRNGIFIAEHRKDFIVTVAPCDFASAELDISKSTCDGLNVNFANNSSSILNLTFDWDFGDPASGALNTSNAEMPSHAYTVPGDYIVRLIVNRNTPCADTAFSLQRVWPGFYPAFKPIPPTCKDVPVQFTDLTTTDFPPINYWRWDFGDQTVTSDTNLLQNPTYAYHTVGTYTVEFIVQSDKGCRDTLYPEVKIVDKPDFFVTNDTLICTIDTLQLHTNVTTGTITWSPNYMISDIHSFNPLVSPDLATTYTVTYSDPSGCTATETVFVNVVNNVTLLSLNDTTICRTDTTQLHLNTDALYFAWTPANVILNPTAQNPLVFPTDPTTVFHVKASISNKCFKEKDITVRTVPYPVAVVSGDEQICFGKNAQLHASGGSIYLWSPSAYLNSAVIPDPVAIAPKQTLTYTVSVRDTLGCPKPVFKTITVNVIRLFANAGPSDTSVVLGQPLYLQATGSTGYTWTPATYLDNPSVATPVSLPQNNITYTVTVNNELGCTASDTINVKVFFLPPDMYVPSAFTPGGDGNNELFRPIALGIRSLESFRVFTRWGMLIYQTSIIGAGWDGTYKGKAQDPGTFVWEATAIDYKGTRIFRKGTVILIR